jgi:transposase
VHLANTAAIKRYEGLKHSGDEDDAAYLAHLLRLGILPSGYICPPAARAVRDLARKRMQLVRSRTAQVLSVENMLSRETGAGMRSRAVQRLTAQAVESFGFHQDVGRAMCANVAVIKTLNREIDKLEQRLHQCVRLRPEFRLLTSVPGIGQTLATLIMLEVGTIERFAAVGNFASYARCVDSAPSPMARRRGRATSRMATRTWLGRSWKQRTLPTVIVRKPGASMNARRRGPTGWWPPRRSRTNWRAPATTCSRSKSLST